MDRDLIIENINAINLTYCGVKIHKFINYDMYLDLIEIHFSYRVPNSDDVIRNKYTFEVNEFTKNAYRCFSQVEDVFREHIDLYYDERRYEEIEI